MGAFAINSDTIAVSVPSSHFNETPEKLAELLGIDNAVSYSVVFANDSKTIYYKTAIRGLVQDPYGEYDEDPATADVSEKEIEDYIKSAPPIEEDVVDPSGIRRTVKKKRPYSKKDELEDRTLPIDAKEFKVIKKEDSIEDFQRREKILHFVSDQSKLNTLSAEIQDLIDSLKESNAENYISPENMEFIITELEGLHAKKSFAANPDVDLPAVVQELKASPEDRTLVTYVVKILAKLKKSAVSIAASPIIKGIQENPEIEKALGEKLSDPTLTEEGQKNIFNQLTRELGIVVPTEESAVSSSIEGTQMYNNIYKEVVNLFNEYSKEYHNRLPSEEEIENVIRKQLVNDIPEDKVEEIVEELSVSIQSKILSQEEKRTEPTSKELAPLKEEAAFRNKLDTFLEEDIGRDEFRTTNPNKNFTPKEEVVFNTIKDNIYSKILNAIKKYRVQHNKFPSYDAVKQVAEKILYKYINIKNNKNTEKGVDDFVTNSIFDHADNIISFLSSKALKKHNASLDIEDRIVEGYLQDMLFKVAFSFRYGTGALDNISNDQPTEVLNAEGDTETVTKTTSGSGENLYTVKPSDTSGEEPVTYKDTNQDFQKLNQEGTPVLAFTTEDRKILAQLGYTI